MNRRSAIGTRFLSGALALSAVGAIALLTHGRADASSGDKYKVTQAPPTVGGSCRVTSGSSKGKVGKYTKSSTGSFFCEGSFGGSECGGTPNKCESVTPAPVK